jgi:hypothetical protein
MREGRTVVILLDETASRQDQDADFFVWRDYAGCIDRKGLLPPWRRAAAGELLLAGGTAGKIPLVE